MQSNVISTREWFSYGYLAEGISDGGLSYLAGDWLSNLRWYFATYTRDAIVIETQIIDTREWRSYGYLGYGTDRCGAFCLNITFYLVSTYWHTATRYSKKKANNTQ